MRIFLNGTKELRVDLDANPVQNLWHEHSIRLIHVAEL